jgi:DNA-binding response OmpR family regulator/tetratricopeptide (TPR) repeat protein
MPPPQRIVALQRGALDLDTGLLGQPEAPLVRLTSLERRLLGYLVEREGAPVERQELHAAVWPEGGQLRAVDDCVRRVRRKVERIADQPEHLLSAFGVGYLFVRAAPPQPAAQPVPCRGVSLGPHCFIDLTRHQFVRHGQCIPLSSNEVRLIERLAERRGEIVPREALIRAIFGRRGVRALENLVLRLRRKLEDHPSEPVWLCTVRGGGLRLAAREQGPAYSLPRHFTRLLGREVELRELGACIDRHPLVVLIGPGGVGKSRLAAEVAGALLPSRPGGVLFCALASAQGEAGLLGAMAEALSVQAPTQRLASSIRLALQQRGRTLLVLDGFEHLQGSASVLLQWVEVADLLVTSRSGLALPGEQQFRLRPLGPEAAVALLLERAKAVDAAVHPERDSRWLQTICEQLDYLPLAIELAARWLVTFSPERLSERLMDLGTALEDPAQTLRRAVARSWDLLRAHEREALARLSLCREGLGERLAERLLDDLHPFPLDLLRSLCEAGVLQAERIGGDIRFRAYDAVARFCHRQVDDADRQRHQTHLAATLASLGSPAFLRSLGWTGCEGRFRQLLPERANLLAAAEHALQQRQTEVVVHACCALLKRSELLGGEEEALSLSDLALSLPDLSLAHRLELLLARSNELGLSKPLARVESAEMVLLAPQGLGLGKALLARAPHVSPSERGQLLERAAEQFTAEREVGLLGWALWGLGKWRVVCGDIDEADRLFGRAIAAHESVGDLVGTGITRMSLARLHGLRGWIDAIREYEIALAALRRVDHRRAMAIGLLNLAAQYMLHGRLDEAWDRSQQALVIHQDLRDPQRRGLLYVGLAEIEALHGEWARAERWASEALLWMERADAPSLIAGTLVHLAGCARQMGQLERSRAHLLRALAQGEPRTVEVGLFWDEMARTELASGDPAAACAALAKGDALTASLGLPAFRLGHCCNRAEILAQCGQLPEARAALAEALQLRQAMTLQPGAPLLAALGRASACVGSPSPPTR